MIACKIKELSIKDKKTLSQKALKLTEEVGELAKVILPYDSAHGTHHRFVDRESILEQIIDVYLCNISIHHSLGFTEEEFNEMLVKKTNKWDKLQHNEEKSKFPLPFEIHVTIALEEQFFNKFREDCKIIGVKPIVIDLEVNDTIVKDVMTSSKIIGDNRMAYEESKRIVNELENMGYEVIRNKIESVPWHPASPSVSTGKEIPNDCYFESHIGVLIVPKQKGLLNIIINDLNNGDVLTGTVKLSSNFFKKVKDGRFVNMVTYRNNLCGQSQFTTEVEVIKEVLTKYSFEYEKVDIEYAVYDTNRSHDSKWLN